MFWQGLRSSGNFLSTEGPRQAGSEKSWLWWLLGVEPSQGMGWARGRGTWQGWVKGQREAVAMLVFPAGLSLPEDTWPRPVAPEPWSGHLLSHPVSTLPSTSHLALCASVPSPVKVGGHLSCFPTSYPLTGSALSRGLRFPLDPSMGGRVGPCLQPCRPTPPPPALWCLLFLLGPRKDSFLLDPRCNQCCSSNPEEETKACKGEGPASADSQDGAWERLGQATLVPETPSLLAQPLSQAPSGVTHL